MLNATRCTFILDPIQRGKHTGIRRVAGGGYDDPEGGGAQKLIVVKIKINPRHETDFIINIFANSSLLTQKDDKFINAGYGLERNSIMPTNLDTV